MKPLFTFFLLTSALAGWANVNEFIVCHTPTRDRVLKISTNGIGVAKTASKGTRKIASVLNIRTFKTSHGFTKVFKYKNFDARVHIENTKDFNEVNDYFSVKSKKGHQMTFPITCEIE